VKEAIQQTIIDHSTTTSVIGVTGAVTNVGVTVSYFEKVWLPFGITGIEIVWTMSGLLVIGAWYVKYLEGRIKKKEEKLLDLQIRKALNEEGDSNGS
jgi:hypothetical protein